MFKLCQFKDHSEVKFILFHNDDFDTEGLNIDILSELTLNENLEFSDAVANHYPLISYSDFIIRTIQPKARTASHILGELRLECLADIVCENTLISLKQSKLSHSQREVVQHRFNQLKALIK